MKVVNDNFFITKDDVRRVLLHLAEINKDLSKKVSVETLFYDASNAELKKRKKKTRNTP